MSGSKMYLVYTHIYLFCPYFLKRDKNYHIFDRGKMTLEEVQSIIDVPLKIIDGQIKEINEADMIRQS